jgi:3-hydroxyisobutyrate dehydrogenase
MGSAMAGRLLSEGLALRGFDLDASRRAALGAAAVEGVRGVAAPIMLLSLPDARAVGAVLDELLPVLPPGAVLCDTSTLAPEEARGFARRAAAAGAAYLDTPVSGGPTGAAAGTLAAMVGGEAGALALARPVLERLATRIIHVGASGAGQVAKLANNLLVATHLVVAAEALRMAARAGVEPEALLPVLNAATGRSAATEVNWPRWIASGRFDSGFAAGLMRKDLRLARHLAESVGAPLDACGRAVRAWEDPDVPDTADFNRLPERLFTHG